MKLIDKDAVVAEIERRIKVLQNNPYENHKTICHLDSLKQSINTLEVKEVDLENIAAVEWDNYIRKINGEPDNAYMLINRNSYIWLAKHFFELGLQSTQKEEPKKCMYSKDAYTDEDRKVLCDGCEEECKYSHSVNVPFDSKNYELIEATYYIPKGMCAIIEDDKVIIKKK